MTSTKEVALKQTQPVSWTAEQLDLIKRQIAVGATNDELQLFMYQAKKTGLDPLSKQIYFQKRGGKMVIITAIDGYRLVASRTGEHAGTDDAILDDETKPTKATVTVYRMINGVRCPFAATARWSEYCPPSGQDHMWRKMPCTMISKCAEALALRKAFPNELGSLYTDAEMEQAGPPDASAPPTPENDPKPAVTAKPRKPIGETSGVFCEACGTELVLSSSGAGFFCPKYRDQSKGEHTRFPVAKLDAFKQYMAEKARAQQPLPEQPAQVVKPEPDGEFSQYDQHTLK